MVQSGSEAISNAFLDAEGSSSLLIGAGQNQTPPADSMPQPLRNYAIFIDVSAEFSGR
jgi:hypothetical protein